MKRKIILTSIGFVMIVLLGIAIALSCGPRYGYHPMYDPNYGYQGMMDPNYSYGMMGPGYMNRYGMMGPGYGMMDPNYRYGMIGPGNGGSGYNGLELMRSELNLTTDQVRQLYDLARDYRLKYFENRGNVEQLNKLEQKHRKDIEKILTPDQRKNFDKYKRGFDRYGWYGGCPYHNW